VTPFEPKGDQARWRVIYALLTPLKVDDVLTYEQIGQALDLDPEADRHAIQMSMRRAAKELETENKHALDVVANVGYRIVPAPEHLDLARRHQRRAGKALERGRSKLVNVDLSGVEPEVRTAFQVVGQAFAMLVDMNQRLTGRQEKLEKAVTDIAGRSERSEADLAELRARLERLESPPES
jgi:hypothetical protein